MEVRIASKNKEEVFNNLKIINIGTTPNSNFKLDLPFEFLISLQKQEDNSWTIVNTAKSDKVLFKGQPIESTMKVNGFCKLTIDSSDEFITIKIATNNNNVKTTSKKTMNVISEEDFDEQDIEALYGKGSEAARKIKIERRKSEIDKRFASISKEISYKATQLRKTIAQNELTLGILNVLIFVVPISLAFIIKDIIRIESFNGTEETKILFLVSVAFVIITVLLQQAQYLNLKLRGNKNNVTSSSIFVKNMYSLVSYLSFTAIIIASIFYLVSPEHAKHVEKIIPSLALLCSFLCIFLGIFSGFTRNIIAENGEQLDKYESREDYQAVIKDYRQWIDLYINNLTKKKLKDIENKIFNSQLMCVGEYLLGILTAPFLAYGVSQTLAECFPEAAGFIRFSEGFKVSPIFLTLATLMIIFAFHCYAVSFSLSKRVHASNIIKQDGFSDYNVHGVTIHGVESTNNLHKEAKKFMLIATGVVLVEITMNMSYFIGVMGGDIQGMVLSLLAALIPTALLIMETNMVANTKFEMKIKEELLEKTDKEY